MTIDSSWIACFKEEVPEAFVPRPPFPPTAVFCDGQIRLMPSAIEGVVSWEEYIQRQFERHIKRYFERGVSCVILAFDDYAHVPAAKSMTQTKRRRHLPPLEFHARDALPPCVPAGDRWMQCISNRTFKSRVIQLVIHRLTSTLSTLLPGDSQCLIVDYQDAPVRYTKIAPPTPLTGPTMSTPLGEADVKFVRYAGMFEKLQVDSVDGDSIPIALLHMERGGLGQVSVLRLETKLKEQKDAAAQASKKIKLTPGAAAATKRPARVYEYVDIRLLFDALRCMIIPQCTGRAPLASHDGHEMSMLVCLIGLSGSDFTRGLPLVSGKTIHDYLPSIWTRLARAYDTSTRQLNPDAALDVLVSAIYRRKFDKHCCVGGGLDEVLSSIKTSSLSIKTRERLPSRETLHCTVRNVNWLLCYWHQPDYPDPVQPQFGFVRDRKGVRFDA